MSYYTEHQRMKPVLDKAQVFDIGKNPAPEALFDPLIAGFNIWCIPEDHPAGWEAVEMDQGAFSKPCAFVATVTWRWNEDEAERDASIDRIIGLNLTTMAYALRDLTLEREGIFANKRWRKQDETLYTSDKVRNRPEDVAWAKAKTRWLFEAAGVPLPPIYTENS